MKEGKGRIETTTVLFDSLLSVHRLEVGPPPSVCNPIDCLLPRNLLHTVFITSRVPIRKQYSIRPTDE